MRRPTKATTSSSRNGTTTAAFSTGYENLPPSSTTSSHLELSSANADDNEITSKIHKKKYNKQRYQRGSSIAIAAVCSLIAFGTLYFVAKYVSSMISIGGTKSRSTSASIHHQQRKTILAENNNVDEDKYNHHHHHTNQLPPDSIYRAKVTDIHGTLQDLHQYAGSISLIVNVACEWGLTHSNYKELAMLHNKYSSPQPTTTMTKFNVLAFPSNDFHQEKETNEEILSYVQTNFPEVTFPLFSRAPLSSNMVFQLCQKQTQSKVEWNFHKFLVDGDGKCVKSYGHRVQPMDIEEDIVRLIMLEEEKRKSGGAGAGGNGGLQVPVTY